MQYDADEQPDPDAWLELDETERIDLVIEYHRRTGVQLETPNLMPSPMWWSKTKLRWAKRRRCLRHSTGLWAKASTVTMPFMPSEVFS